jgi:lysyl endopeptidase
MKLIYRQLLALGIAFGLSSSISYAQLSEGGVPYSFTHNVQQKSTLPAVGLMKPDVDALLTMDAVNDALGKPYRVGFNIPVNYNVNNSGTWETTPDGGHLWRLRLRVDDALALGLYYHNFFIPSGGKVFLYNEHENHVIGAFTDAYNFNNTIRATQMIEGSTITIEYFAPIGTIGMPIIEIKEVVYFYRGIEDFLKPIVDEATGGNAPSNLLKAQSCQIDVACAPERNGWEDQINSAVHYTFSQGMSSYVCSAAMINNTNQDCTPYILSAWHCGEPNAGSNISTWVWYWNYQKTTCAPNNNGTNPSKGTQTMTGGTVRASSGNGTLNNPPGTNQLAGSDFYLVELSSQPPVAYNAYYAGWDRSNTAATSGKGIHHPAGSAKKISTYTSTLVSSSYNGGPANTHWRVIWAATTNGHGVTEGGSSGSPIFDQNGRIAGQLSGGSSYCNATTSPDLYGKMYTNWDLNGTSNAARFKTLVRSRKYRINLY